MPTGDAEPATPPPPRERGPRHFAPSAKARRRPRAPREAGEPREPRPPREPRELPIRVADDTTTLQRVRSGVVLGLLIAIIGAIAAVVIGVTAVIVITTLKQAVG